MSCKGYHWNGKSIKTIKNDTVSPTKNDPVSSTLTITPLEKRFQKLGGKKFDAGKIRTDLLPIKPLELVAEVLSAGALKYGANNWREGFIWSRLYGAALRHIFAWQDRRELDEETGISHLAHGVCCLLFLLEFQAKNLGEDDRP